MENNEDIAMLQMDFSENYTARWQYEIQPAHYGANQITIYCACFWHGSNIKSSVVVSNDLSHTKDSIMKFLDVLMPTLLNDKIQTLHIWADGPSSQFKNKYMVNALPWMIKRYGINIQWNYFASSHGKGAVDGVGCSIKRQVFEKVKQRRAEVRDAASFFQCARKYSSNIYVHLVDINEITQYVSENVATVFEGAMDKPGIAKIHCVTGNAQLDDVCLTHYTNFSNDSELSLTELGSQKTEESESEGFVMSERDIHVGDHIQLTCEPFKNYYAVVLQVLHDNEFKIQYIEKKYGKFVLKDYDFDSRSAMDMVPVCAEVDNRDRYTFS